MEKTKIQLSADELQLMRNGKWILTKNSIIEKVIFGLGEFSGELQQYLISCQPLIDKEILLPSPKISRGEKYQGLPYVILDYPRIFGKEDILAIRVLFWWGNYCSITLHVKGKWQPVLTQKILSEFDKLQTAGFYISFSGDEWTHNLLEDDYRFFQQLIRKELAEKLPGSNFLKLAAKIEIDTWEIMKMEFRDLYIRLAALLKA